MSISDAILIYFFLCCFSGVFVWTAVDCYKNGDDLFFSLGFALVVAFVWPVYLVVLAIDHLHGKDGKQ
jgi:hypothetical protein